MNSIETPLGVDSRPSKLVIQKHHLVNDENTNITISPYLNEPDDYSPALLSKDWIINELIYYGAILSLVSLTFGSIYLFFGDSAKNGTPLFALCLIWILSQILGRLTAFCHLPSILGMLLAGIILKNVPGRLVDALPPSWSSLVRSCGLGLILLRSGMEIEIDVFHRIGLLAFLLTVVPSTVEAFACGPLGLWIFGMPLTYGWTMGFILSSVSGAVVVVLMFNLQRDGWGRAKGIPCLIMAASSFDDIIAIGGYTIFMAIALSANNSNLVWTVSSGPISFAVGVLIGTGLGVLCGMTRIWNTHGKRITIALLSTQFCMLLSRRIHMEGIGAMTALVSGIVMTNCWRVGYPHGFLSVGSMPLYVNIVERKLSLLWNGIAQPLLFGVIGSAVDFKLIKSDMVPRALVLLCFSLTARLISTWLCLLNSHLNTWERAYVTLAWIPKATVQAALASAPLDLIRISLGPGGVREVDSAKFKQAEQHGLAILATCVLSVVLTAPSGLIILTYLGPRWLTQDVPENVALDDGDDDEEEGNCQGKSLPSEQMEKDIAEFSSGKPPQLPFSHQTSLPGQMTEFPALTIGKYQKSFSDNFSHTIATVPVTKSPSGIRCNDKVGLKEILPFDYPLNTSRLIKKVLELTHSEFARTRESTPHSSVSLPVNTSITSPPFMRALTFDSSMMSAVGDNHRHGHTPSRLMGAVGAQRDRGCELSVLKAQKALGRLMRIRKLLADRLPPLCQVGKENDQRNLLFQLDILLKSAFCLIESTGEDIMAAEGAIPDPYTVGGFMNLVCVDSKCEMMSMSKLRKKQTPSSETQSERSPNFDHIEEGIRSDVSKPSHKSNINPSDIPPTPHNVYIHNSTMCDSSQLNNSKDI